MAELKSDLLTFSAAASGITLTISKRLARNFSYYRKRAEQPEEVYRDELLSLLLEVKQLSYSLHNMLIDPSAKHSPFMVAIAGQIVDILDDIHRKLLLFDAEKIANIIPPLDSLRNIWIEYTEPGFYDDNLSFHIEHQFPFYILKIETDVRSLPYIAIL